MRAGSREAGSRAAGPKVVAQRAAGSRAAVRARAARSGVAVAVWEGALEVVAELSKRVQTCAPTRPLL